jgi:hypothetical protein
MPLLGAKCGAPVFWQYSNCAFKHSSLVIFALHLINEPFAFRELIAQHVFAIVVIHGAVFVYLTPPEVNVTTFLQNINVGDVSVVWVNYLDPVGKDFSMAGLDSAAPCVCVVALHLVTQKYDHV